MTRTVLLLGPWAFKLPALSYRWGVRGWLANQSEWRQRARPDIARPVLTLGHLVLVMPRADRVCDRPWGALSNYRGDEAKPSSWGHFAADGVVRLIDYDNSEKEPRTRIGRWYWGREERRAREWAAL